VKTKEVFPELTFVSVMRDVHDQATSVSLRPATNYVVGTPAMAFKKVTSWRQPSLRPSIASGIK
jgi:hypothetical protein